MTTDGLRQHFTAVQSGASARLVQVIEVQVRRGCGVTYCTEPPEHNRIKHQHERVRMVTLYFTPDGTLLAERDPAPGPVTAEELRESGEMQAWEAPS